MVTSRFIVNVNPNLEIEYHRIFSLVRQVCRAVNASSLPALLGFDPERRRELVEGRLHVRHLPGEHDGQKTGVDLGHLELNPEA